MRTASETAALFVVERLRPCSHAKDAANVHGARMRQAMEGAGPQHVWARAGRCRQGVAGWGVWVGDVKWGVPQAN